MGIFSAEEPIAVHPWSAFKRGVVFLLGLSFCLALVIGIWLNLTKEQEFVQLDVQKQKSIWDLEHIAFEIESRFGDVFTQALARGDSTELSRFFADGFRGKLFHSAPGIRHSISGVIQLRHQGDVSLLRPAGVEEVVGFLLAARKHFADLQRVSLRVLFIDRVPGQQHRFNTRILISAWGKGDSGKTVEWLAQQEITFEFRDETDLSGGSVVRRWDLRSHTLSTCTGDLMQEVTLEAGLDKIPLPDNWNLPPKKRQQYQFKMAVEDFDRDGWLDIAIAPFENRPILLRGLKGGRFEDVADAYGVRSRVGMYALATWIDYDNDDYPDLLLGQRLYHNVGGKEFVDVTEESGLTIGQADLMSCAVADYDCDGRLDLYIAIQPIRGATPAMKMPWIGDSIAGQENQLWRNEGGGRFRDVTRETRTGGGLRHSFAAAWLFVDDDHRPDLYVANDFGANLLLRNSGEGFEDFTGPSGTGDFATSMGVAVGDVNNDGHSDIYVANMYSKMGRRIIAQVDAEDYPAGVFQGIQGACAGNRLYRQVSGQSRFHECAESLGVNGIGWAHAPAMADFNGDGWLDLYATAGFMSFNRKKPDG